MAQVIRIPETIYDRLAKLASGFETPASVIERLLEFYDQNKPKQNKMIVTTLKKETHRIQRQGRKGYNQVEHYLIPVITLIKGEGKTYIEAFHTVAQQLSVEYGAVLSQCTRALDMHLDDFLNHVEDGRILDYIMDKYYDKKDYIKRELGKYY